MAPVVPIPPEHLRERTGATQVASPDARIQEYLDVGRACRDELERSLPADWRWGGRRVLDFGCGAGRTLRHFVGEAAVAEFYGCDIDGASIAWLEEHAPMVTALHTEPVPPLPLPDAHFDLVYALSVFTHLDEHWADWLLELHRVLKPDGILLATFLGGPMSELVIGAPSDEAEIGMLVEGAGRTWDLGGPFVLLSPWWIRAHWGRAFELVSLHEEGFASPAGSDGPSQGWVVARPRSEPPTRAALVAPEPDEPREWAALTRAHRHALTEQVRLRSDLASALEQGDALTATLAAIQTGGWWRLRARLRPLLALVAAVRRRRARLSRPARRAPG